MSGDMMGFPNDWKDFLRWYSFQDREEVYTNGSDLIPTFRVEQMMEFYLRKALREQDSNANQHVSNTSNALVSFNQKTEADTVKGCKLCNSARFDIAAQTRDPDDMYVFSADPVIGAMFCPLCGRRLEEV